MLVIFKNKKHKKLRIKIYQNKIYCNKKLKKMIKKNKKVN